MPELQDANPAESSPAADANVGESSTPELEEATSQQAVQQEAEQPPFHEHPRWKQLQEEKTRAAEEAAYYRGIAEQAQKAAQPAGSKPDPYANMSAEEKVFYQSMRQLAREEAEVIAAQERERYQQQLKIIASQNVQVQEKLFREENKDIIPGSLEEQRVADLIRKGYSINDAAWVVMGPKRVESAKSQGVKTQQQKIQQKAKANLETTSIPTVNPLPQDKKLSFREKLERNAKDLNLGV